MLTVVLCYVLCCAMLCRVVLCFVLCRVLCRVVLCYAVLCSTVLCCVVLCCVVLCSVLLYCVVLYCVVLKDALHDEKQCPIHFLWSLLPNCQMVARFVSHNQLQISSVIHSHPSDHFCFSCRVSRTSEALWSSQRSFKSSFVWNFHLNSTEEF